MEYIYSTQAWSASPWVTEQGAVWFVGYGDAYDMPATVSEMLIFPNETPAGDIAVLWQVIAAQAMVSLD